MLSDIAVILRNPQGSRANTLQQYCVTRQPQKFARRPRGCRKVTEQLFCDFPVLLGRSSQSIKYTLSRFQSDNIIIPAKINLSDFFPLLRSATRDEILIINTENPRYNTTVFVTKDLAVKFNLLL